MEEIHARFFVNVINPEDFDASGFPRVTFKGQCNDHFHCSNIVVNDIHHGITRTPDIE